MASMNSTPDLTHFYAIHRKMRIDTRLFARAIETATVDDRRGRLRPLARWARGFAHELDEHHFVEDEFFFPELCERIPSAATILGELDADHRVVDDILGRWARVTRALTTSDVPFPGAKEEALDLAVTLRDLLQRHLDIEDHDILPLYTRHYSAADFDVVYQRAVKNGKKAGLSFVVPWNVLCLEPESRQELIDPAPIPLKVIWRLTRGRFERLETAAFCGVHVDLDDLAAVSTPPRH
jgi:hemerythrin-like domain-containing protein